MIRSSVTASQVAQFHLSYSHYRQCNAWLYVFDKTTLSFNYRSRFVSHLVPQWQNVHVPPLALRCSIKPKDDRITSLCTLWTTPSVTLVRNSYVHARNRLHMLMVLQSEAEIWMCKVMDRWPLTRKVAYGCQIVIQGQGCFIIRGLSWGGYHLWGERGMVKQLQTLGFCQIPRIPCSFCDTLFSVKKKST